MLSRNASKRDGFLPRNFTALSPSPTPSLTRPPVRMARVAKALATTVGSRVWVFVTAKPTTVREVAMAQ